MRKMCVLEKIKIKDVLGKLHPTCHVTNEYDVKPVKGNLHEDVVTAQSQDTVLLNLEVEINSMFLQ